MSRPLILASSSRYRRELLERLGLSFMVRSPGVDETSRPGEPARDLVARLAREKAIIVARMQPDALVVGSDQLAVLDGQILGKPGSEARAVEQLRAASGREVDFLTAVTLAWDGGARIRSKLDVTRVCFRALGDAAIRDYVAREQPLDCAGAFKSEGLGIALFHAVHTEDPTALIGLPLIALCGLLAEAGQPVLGAGD